MRRRPAHRRAAGAAGLYEQRAPHYRISYDEVLQQRQSILDKSCVGSANEELHKTLRVASRALCIRDNGEYVLIVMQPCVR